MSHMQDRETLEQCGLFRVHDEADTLLETCHKVAKNFVLFRRLQEIDLDEGRFVQMQNQALYASVMRCLDSMRRELETEKAMKSGELLIGPWGQE